MPVPPASDTLALRCLALRAIMDGRGLEAVILSTPRSLAHYGGVRAGQEPGGLLVVTAREALRVPASAEELETWERAAHLLPRGCALGHEGGMAEGLSLLARRLAPRRMLCIGAEVARQVAGWNSQAPAGQTAEAWNGGPEGEERAAGQQALSRGGGR